LQRIRETGWYFREPIRLRRQVASLVSGRPNSSAGVSASRAREAVLCLSFSDFSQNSRALRRMAAAIGVMPTLEAYNTSCGLLLALGPQL
jgi:hypothetical protein